MNQYAPCVISKAKLALGLPNRYRCNSKRFSVGYWERVLRDVAGQNRTEQQVQDAINQYQYFLNLRNVV